MAVRENSREAELAGLMKLMVSETDTGLLLSKSVDTVIDLLKADSGCFIMVDSKGKLHTEISRDTTGAEKLRSRAFVKEALKTGKTIYVSDILADDRFAYDTDLLSSKIRAAACIPMWQGNRIRGLIYIDKKIPGAFTEEDITLAESVAESLSTVLKKTRIHSRMRKRLQDTEEKLTRADKLSSIGTLAGGMAHEINNPVGAILTSVQTLLIEFDEKDEDTRETLQVIQEAARKCREIVQKLLSYSRISEESPKQALDINEVIEEALLLVSPQARKHGISVKKDLTRPLTVWGNSAQLQQVFTNMALNSIIAINEDERERGEIFFSTLEENGFIITSIEDNGQGIPSVNLTRLFDPFFTTRQVSSGTGLGLYISYNIIKEHEGVIEVESELGKGTKFIVKLPGYSRQLKE